MFIDISSLIEYCKGMTVRYPVWFTAVSLGIHIAALLFCAAFGKSNPVSEKKNPNRNSVCTAFWLCVIVTMPFAGIILYLLLSVVPYAVWHRKTGESAGFPLTFRLKKNQLKILIVSGIGGTLLQNVTQAAGHSFSEISLGFEAAFISWLIIVLFDWNKSVYKKAVFLRVKQLSAAPEQFRRYRADDILGKKHYAERESDFAPDKVSRRKIVRKAADEIFLEAYTDQAVAGGTFEYGGTKIGYEVVAFQKQFEKGYTDAVEVKYLRGGITEYKIYEWSQEEEGVVCFERVIYRAAARIRYFIARSVILFSVFLMLFSPWFTVIGRFFTEIADKIAGGLRV